MSSLCQAAPRLGNVLLSKNFIYLPLSEIYLGEHVNDDDDDDVFYVIVLLPAS